MHNKIMTFGYKKKLDKNPSVTLYAIFLGNIFEFFLCNFPYRNLLVHIHYTCPYIWRKKDALLTARGGLAESSTTNASFFLTFSLIKQRKQWCLTLSFFSRLVMAALYSSTLSTYSTMIQWDAIRWEQFLLKCRLGQL